MKKFLFLFLMMPILSCVEVQGQEYVPFPMENAIWNEVFTNQQPEVLINTRYVIYSDTTINEIAYQKIYTTNKKELPVSSNDLIEYMGAIRENENRQIFLIDFQENNNAMLTDGTTATDEEFMLYDFTKNVGDVIYNPFFWEGETIENIDSILINDTYRKVYHFSDSQWIEGIGSNLGLFNPLYLLSTGYDKNELVCMYENNNVTYLNPNFNSCFPPFSVENISLNKFSIYPNPTKSKVNVKSESNQFYVLTIKNLSGQEVKQIQQVHNGTSIDINFLSSGIYILTLDNEKNKYQTKLTILK